MVWGLSLHLNNWFLLLPDLQVATDDEILLSQTRCPGREPPVMHWCLQALSNSGFFTGHGQLVLGLSLPNFLSHPNFRLGCCSASPSLWSILLLHFQFPSFELLCKALSRRGMTHTHSTSTTVKISLISSSSSF